MPTSTSFDAAAEYPPSEASAIRAPCGTRIRTGWKYPDNGPPRSSRRLPIAPGGMVPAFSQCTGRSCARAARPGTRQASAAHSSMPSTRVRPGERASTSTVVMGNIVQMLVRLRDECLDLRVFGLARSLWARSAVSPGASARTAASASAALAVMVERIHPRRQQADRLALCLIDTHVVVRPRVVEPRPLLHRLDHLRDRRRHLYVCAVYHHMLLQTGRYAQWHVRRTRQSNRSARDRHTPLRSARDHVGRHSWRTLSTRRHSHRHVGSGAIAWPAAHVAAAVVHRSTLVHGTTLAHRAAFAVRSSLAHWSTFTVRS